jgi:hypothetical protein
MVTASTATDVCMDTCVFVNVAIVGRVEVIAKISGLLFLNRVFSSRLKGIRLTDAQHAVLDHRTS